MGLSVAMVMVLAFFLQLRPMIVLVQLAFFTTQIIVSVRVVNLIYQAAYIVTQRQSAWLAIQSIFLVVTSANLAHNIFRTVQPARIRQTACNAAQAMSP